MNRFIVITGASMGIGRAAADPLIEQGWSVIGVALAPGSRASEQLLKHAGAKIRAEKKNK